MINQDLDVDVILPIYNAKKWVFESIESVISQTYKKWHLIVVDDASNDGMLEKLEKKYGHLNGKISFIKLKENLRAVGARNEIISISCGDVIAFIDQDDLWMPNKLKKQIDILLNKQGFHAVHTDIQKIDGDGNLIKQVAEMNSLSDFVRQYLPLFIIGGFKDWFCEILLGH